MKRSSIWLGTVMCEKSEKEKTHMEHGIRLSELVEKMNLKNLTPEVETAEKEVNVPDVNRPALQLAGFFDHLIRTEFRS